MEEQDVNNFSQSVIPEFGTSISATLMPGIWEGVNKIVQGQANKAELERKKKQELASIAEELDPAVVWELDQGEILKFAEEKEAELTDEAVKNKYDLDELNYGDFAKKVKNTKKELAIKAKKAEENQKGFDKVQEDYKIQKRRGDRAEFDLEHMEAWIDKFKSAKSIDERNAMIRDTDNSAYERNYALLDMAEAMLPKPDVTRDANGTTRVFINEQAYANRIFEYISSQDGEGYYDKHKNPNETKEEFADRMANKFVNDDRIVSEQLRESPPKTQSGSGGRTSAKYGFDVTPSFDETTSDIWLDKSKKEKNKITFTAKNVNVGLPKKDITLYNPKTGKNEVMKYSIVDAYYGSDGEIYLDLHLYDTEGKAVSDSKRETGVKYEDYDEIFDMYLGPGKSIRKALEDASKPTGSKPASTTKTQTSTKKTGTGKFPAGFDPNK